MERGVGAPAQARFVFEGLGSRGDIAPLLALVPLVLGRGHACTVIAPAAFREEVLSLGADFVANTTRRIHFQKADSLSFENYYFAGLPDVREYFISLLQTTQGVVVVNIDKACASNLLAEKFALPTVRLHLSPFQIRSRVAPPMPAGLMPSGALAQAFLKYTVPERQRAADEDPRLIAYVNESRAAFELRPLASLAAPEPHVRKQLGMFADWFCAPASDWPDTLELVGFPLPVPSGALPSELEQFLAAHGKPLVFTSGTGAVDEQFFEHARACCSELGRPGIFLSLHAAHRDHGLMICQTSYAELGQLLPRAALFVHHGGIGSLARALEAGVPQIISPRGFDQPDNARRARELGVGQVIARHALSGPTLARAARQLWASQECAESCQKLAQSIQSDPRAEARCADVLAGVLREASSVSQQSVASRRGRRTLLFIVWPEPGHLAAPLTLARQLRAQGERVVFSGLNLIQREIIAENFEFFELAPLARRAGKGPTSILWAWSGDALLESAVAHLVQRFRQLVREVGPALVLLDSLYSVLGALPASEQLPWVIYETDLPRELDPRVPPPGCAVVPSPAAEAQRALRSGWAQLLRSTSRARKVSKRLGTAGGWSLSTAYPDALSAALEQQLGKPRVPLNRRTAMAPVARVERLIFCPKSFDFPRSRVQGFHWVDACVDLQRAEPEFPWERVPQRKQLVYCSLGTQAIRSPCAAAILQTIMTAFELLDDFFLILACSRHHAVNLRVQDGSRFCVTERAPQLEMIRRASLVITHGGFNSIKECITLATPVVAVPLSHDQPRNAALLEYHGVGMSLATGELTPERVAEAVLRVAGDSALHQRCRDFSQMFLAEAQQRTALSALAGILERARTPS